MNKRDAVLSLLDMEHKPSYTPAAFFLHFPPSLHFGQGAIDQHLQFFYGTGMDFVKIQYEKEYPVLPEIRTADDWRKMPSYPLDFYRDQLDVVAGLVKAAKQDALVILTLYSPFMCARHSLAEELSVEQHILDNPQAVKQGMQAVTDSLMGFVKEAIRLGVDGFYHSTQGGEFGRFNDLQPFNECIRPYDLELMEEINRSCIFNILHVCDYHLPYRDLSSFVDYPGHIVNTNLQLVDRSMTPLEVSALFGGRPFMGGLDRHGALAHGSPDEVREQVRRVLADAPDRFILGADCTVPANTPWENLRAA
ncbi:MAG: uroporphyrinogen decarboxylase family protein, partial [Anaerolineaceae bacterium]